MKNLPYNLIFDKSFSIYTSAFLFKILLLFYFVLFFAFSLFSQDLIERTRNGQLPSISKETPNQLAALIESKRSARLANDTIRLFDYPEQSQTRFQNFLSNAIILNLNSTAVADLWSSNLSSFSLEIPVNSKSAIELELVQVDLYTEDFVVNTSEGRGGSNVNNGVFYRGIVKGDPQSLVALSVFKENVRMLIGDKEGNYVVGKMGTSADYILYNDLKLLKSNPFECDVSEKLSDLDENDLKSVQQVASRNSTCIPIYVECEYQMYLDHGSSVAAVTAYVGALINEVATIYANEQIDISLSEVKVWTTPDPYSNFVFTSGILTKFGQTLQNNYNGRLAHLITTDPGFQGIAKIDVLCSSYDREANHLGPYAFSRGMNTSIVSVPTFSWDVQVFAHEMGHNLGSLHTQHCSWNGNNTAIDGCGTPEGDCSRPIPYCPPDKGTIMSYCRQRTDCGVVFANGFGPQPGNLIRSKYFNAPCVLDCTTSTCPNIETISGTVHGVQTYQANQTIISNATISSDATVKFIAGQSIEMRSGFYVQLGGDFQTIIEDCNSSSSCSDDRDALVALYNTTNGLDWNLSNSINSWSGVTTNSEGCVTHLILDHKQLTGTIPTELGSLGSLVELDLSWNQLTGEIPPTLGNLSTLEKLILFQNDLTGSIPTTLGNLSNLESLGLSFNNLSGTIPVTFGNLNKIKNLALNKNQITGTIPASLGNLGVLSSLHLNNNMLTGSIPSELGNLSNISYLNLHHNQLSGCFPLALQPLCSVFDKDFTNNPNLPEGGDFDMFCNNGTGGCSSLTSLESASSRSKCLKVIEQSAALQLILIPNPVKSEVLIKYNMPISSEVNLAIYDIQGKVTKVIHNNELLIDGTHQELIDATTFPSGIYFIRLETNSQNKIIKMIVTRN